MLGEHRPIDDRVLVSAADAAPSKFAESVSFRRAPPGRLQKIQKFLGYGHRRDAHPGNFLVAFHDGAYQSQNIRRKFVEEMRHGFC